MSGPRTPSSHGSLVPSIVLLVFVALYAATGFWTLDPASRAVPLLAAGVTALLIVIELVKRSTTARREPLVHSGSTSGSAHERRVLASVIGAVAGVYLVGFLVALPIYLALTIALIGRQPWRLAVVTAGLTTAGIYLAFEVVLSYRLFAGVVFS